MTEMEQEKRASLHADVMLRRALDLKAKVSRWKCSYGKSCECKSNLEKSECDLAYIAKTKEQLRNERRR